MAVCNLVETVWNRPDWGNVAYQAVVPQFAPKPFRAESILPGTGILGATVMPHAISLHSALAQNRIVVRDSVQLPRLFRFKVMDVLIAMSIAELVMAATGFHQQDQRRGLRHRVPRRGIARRLDRPLHF